MLRWALGLVPAAMGGGWATFRWLDERERRMQEEELGPEDGWEVEGGRVLKGGPEKHSKSPEARAAELAQEAAWYSFAGHPSASITANLALEVYPSSAPARLVRACWCMQENRWDLVREDLTAPSLRDTPEARLLLEFADRQPRAADWRHAFFDSWKALGQPDFRKSPLLPAPIEWNHLNSNQITWLPPGEDWLFPIGVLSPDSAKGRESWMREQVLSSQSVPLLLALREQLLSLEDEAPLRQACLASVEERLGQLAGPTPRTLQLALVPFLSGTSRSAPFERRELEALETLAVLREWKQPSSEEVFREMRVHTDMLHGPAHHAWVLTCMAQATSHGTWLLQRARASKAHLTEDELRWLGRLLYQVGARLREQRSRLELEMGLRLQMFGSELMQHVPTREECIAAWIQLGNWEDAVKKAAYDRWPIGPLREESCEHRARNELAWMQAFAGRGQLP
ncbi:MAG TPA: hypothetical protein VFZ09_31290 [Archangium sp.]|uniref:hypothetical protein n=1 Tax=Archangium sp. TaxID=1872627 RepID=UPI002E312F13|nr:hypothetical protein [Archangium sp.]HEX5750752.1 hypothetical protein [Archangium sp.]